MSYVGAGSVSGCSRGHLYLHNLSLCKCSNSYTRHAGNTGRNPWPFTTCCFSALAWHLASSWLNWQSLWTTKWPHMIPLPLSKHSPDSWLVNSTRILEAKQDVRCQSGGSHVETSGKVTQLEEARREGGRLFCIKQWLPSGGWWSRVTKTKSQNRVVFS